MTASPDDDDRFDAAFTAALGDVEVRPGFADAVVARRPRPARPLRARLRPVLSVFTHVAVAAAAAVVVGVASRDAVDVDVGRATGHVVAAERATVVVPGAVIVAEAGADVAWDDGRVSLGAGDAFFRVAPRDAGDGAFVVDTPAGAIVATGTCFSVHVTPQEGSMPVTALSPPSSKRSIAAAAAGLVVGAVTVHVYEGSVRLENDRGSVAVVAGHDGALAAASAPTTTAPPPTTPSTMTTTTTSTDAATQQALQTLTAENARLRAIVDKQDEALALTDAVVEDAEGGAPRAFPDDLPQRLSEAALQKAFADGFGKGGLDGTVTRVDCSEYPCVVWGEVRFDSADLGDKMRRVPAFAAYEHDGAWVRGFTVRDADGERDVFAITLVPPSDEVERDPLLEKRIRHRTDEGVEQWKAEHPPKQETPKQP